jgi:site-specific DNA-methyltransferase (adenine-specific)
MKSKRNKTITVTQKDLKKYPSLKLQKEISKSELKNKLFHNDFLKTSKFIPSNSINLIVTDPPYTIAKDFGKGKVSTNKTKFKEWCKEWITECHRLLKTNGSIYICINWEASSIIEELLEEKFIIRNRITWKRDKGRGAKKNWKNNMEDIWYATKSDDYTFNLENVMIEKEVIAPYVDKDGKPKDWKEINGKKIRMTHPSNIWTDMTAPFWSMPENTEHPTQKPEKLIERIILASSNKKDLVFDPFIGSGTTAIVAKKLNRNYLGFEIEKKFYTLTQKRLANNL